MSTLEKNNSEVVIIGGGFGGIEAAKRLLNHGVGVTMVDRNNYHLFQPLLYQVAAAYLAPEEIAKPIRAIFRKHPKFSFRMDEVVRAELPEKRIVFCDETWISYDYLIVATGAKPNFFGMVNLKANAFSLKYLEDGVRIRSHLLSCFEKAAHEPDENVRESLLTVVIGGGGSAGVEMAGALAELVSQVLVKDYPDIDRNDVRIQLVEGNNRILPDLPNGLSQKAKDILKRKGVDVLCEAFIEDYVDEKIILKGGLAPIHTATVIWTGGIQGALVNGVGNTAHPDQTNTSGRIPVNELLQIPEHPTAYVIGDAAFVMQAEGPAPMVAPAAVQMAEAAAKNILNDISGRDLNPFLYKSPGTMATIGRNAAVAQLNDVKFHGFFAWMIWLVVHLVRLVGFRNRLIVFINWVWDYLFFERSSRIIFQSFKRGPTQG